MRKIATEEAFTTPAVVAEWEKLLDDGAPGEPGFKLQVGYFRTATDNFTKRVTERLVEFGDLRLQEMDESGIDMQLLSLTTPGVQVFDADTGTALARDTNDFLVETVNNNSDRYAGLAAVAPQAPKSAARELERAVGLGLKGAIINSRFFDVSNGIEEVSERGGDQVDHADEGGGVSVTACPCARGLEQAVEALHASVAVG